MTCCLSVTLCTFSLCYSNDQITCVSILLVQMLHMLPIHTYVRMYTINKIAKKEVLLDLQIYSCDISCTSSIVAAHGPSLATHLIKLFRHKPQ